MIKSAAELIGANRLRKVLLIFTSVVLMIVSYAVWDYVNISVEKQRKQDFEVDLEQIVKKSESRIDFVVEKLYDLKGVVTSVNIDSVGWNKNIIASDIELRYPGNYTFGYIDLVRRGGVGRLH